MTKKKSAVPPNAIHPGEILREEFMIPMGVTACRLAKDLHLSVSRVNDIVREKRPIRADTALRLGRYFGTSAQLWMNLQKRYDRFGTAMHPAGVSS